MLIKKKLHFEVIKVIFNNLRSFNIPRWHIWEETGTTFIDQSGAKLVKQAAQNGGFFRVQIRITFALATTASQIPEIPYLPSRTPSPFRLRPDEPRSPGGAVMNAGLIVRGRRGWQRGHGRAVIRFGRRVGWRNRRRRFDDMCRRMLMMKEVFFSISKGLIANGSGDLILPDLHYGFVWGCHRCWGFCWSGHWWGIRWGLLRGHFNDNGIIHVVVFMECVLF